MRTRRDAERSTPDWVDILLAATLASWATVMIAITAGMAIALVIDFRIEALAFAFVYLVSAAGISFFIAIFACTILGLPALGLAALLRLDAWWQAALIGALAGLIFAGTIVGWRPNMYDWSIVVSGVVLIAAGALAGVAAWRERRKGRLST